MRIDSVRQGVAVVSRCLTGLSFAVSGRGRIAMCNPPGDCLPHHR